MRNTRRVLSCLLPAACCLLPAACCLLLLSGCGGSDGRQSIEGTVTLDGKPMEKGQVNFMPLPGTQGPTAGSEIKDGKFTIAAKGGTFAGKFRVEITASRPSGKKVPDQFSGEMVDAYEQFIPERYNRQSELEAEVKADAPNRFEFAITSE